MYFKEIPGKEQEKQQLISAADEGKIPHAQMLLGKSGSGHLALALAYASYIMCKDRIVGLDSCGKCTACTKSHKYGHPDLHFALPVIKAASLKRDETTSNAWLKEWRTAISEEPFIDIVRWQARMGAENSQPNINKKECVEIVHKLGMKSFESDFKVLILWLPEYLGKEGNRLLKLIEEPSPDTIIIMVADRQEDILNTIISRVQITKVSAFSADEIGRYIGELEGNIEAGLARQIGVMADGNLGLAIHMLEGQEADYSDALFQWLRVAYKMEPKALISWVDDMAKWGRERQKNFLAYGLHFFREYLFMLLSGSENIKLSAKEKQTALKMQKTISPEKAEKLVNLFDKTHAAILRNANAKITFMADSMEIAYIMRDLVKDGNIYQV